MHRIGRTGRAGREGDAILFVAPREKRLLSAIEKATKKKIEMMELPSTELINDKRIENFKQKITNTLASEDLSLFTQLIEQYQTEYNVPANDVAAALAVLLQGDTPLLLKKKPHAGPPKDWDRKDSRNTQRKSKNNETSKDRHRPKNKRGSLKHGEHPLEDDMQRYRLEVGHKHEVKPGNIVGAIANEAGLDSKHIGRIVIHDDYSLIDLPSGMPKDIFSTLKKTWVSGTQLNISELKSRPVSNDYEGNKERDKRSNKKTKSRSKPKNKSRNTNKKHKKKKKKTKLTLS